MSVNNYYKKDDIKFRIATCSDGTGEIIDAGENVVGTVSREQMRQIMHNATRYLSVYAGPNHHGDK